MRRRISFERACAMYVHRYTCEHVPRRKSEPAPNGKYYAPQYRTDREWYDRTIFPGEPGYLGSGQDCYSRGQTWPAGQWLDRPFRALERSTG